MYFRLCKIIRISCKYGWKSTQWYNADCLTLPNDNSYKKSPFIFKQSPKAKQYKRQGLTLITLEYNPSLGKFSFYEKNSTLVK